MKANVGDKLVKVHGGIRTREDLDDFIEAGADRIGTSNSIKLIQIEDGKDY